MSEPGCLDMQTEAAVIDVGSNSVRLVVYRIEGRAMTPLLNEKVMAGLGRRLTATGALAPEGAEAALRALRRYRTLLDAHGVRNIYAVATAAVREAKDGDAFVERVKREVGLSLRVLSGDDEARLAALGVSAGAPNASGVVGDLGGSSMELVAISPRGQVKRGETFALGPLALSQGEAFDYAQASALADERLSASRVLESADGDFYAVGGAWRALGRIDLKMRDHPLGVLHHYEMSLAEAIKLADVVRKQSRKSLERLEDAAAKRAESLPYAAVVLERVLARGKFNRVILSAFGLREGVLLDRMSKPALDMDPLIAAAEAVAGRWSRTREFGPALTVLGGHADAIVRVLALFHLVDQVAHQRRVHLPRGRMRVRLP